MLSPNQKGLLVLFAKHVEFGESLSGNFKGHEVRENPAYTDVLQPILRFAWP